MTTQIRFIKYAVFLGFAFVLTGMIYSGTFTYAQNTASVQLAEAKTVSSEQKKACAKNALEARKTYAQEVQNNSSQYTQAVKTATKALQKELGQVKGDGMKKMAKDTFKQAKAKALQQKQKANQEAQKKRNQAVVTALAPCK